MNGTVRLQLSEAGADAARLDMLTGHLRTELSQFAVNDMERAPTGETPPPGAQAVDVVPIGGLVVSLGRPPARLTEVVAAVRRWLARRSGVRRSVEIEIDGDKLELSEVSSVEQDRLVELFIWRHTGGEG